MTIRTVCFFNLLNHKTLSPQIKIPSWKLHKYTLNPVKANFNWAYLKKKKKNWHSKLVRGHLDFYDRTVYTSSHIKGCSAPFGLCNRWFNSDSAFSTTDILKRCLNKTVFFCCFFFKYALKTSKRGAAPSLLLVNNNFLATAKVLFGRSISV